MAIAVQWGRSLIFMVTIYAWMAVLGLVFAPYALFSKRGALRACKTYARTTIWLARWMVGIRGEVRGNVPTGEVVIAAKHQSLGICGCISRCLTKNAHWSATSSITFEVGFPAPCPALVSMRIKTGLSPA